MADPEIAGSEMIGGRSRDALRAEVQHRADVQRYPLTGIDPEDWPDKRILREIVIPFLTARLVG